MGPFGVSEIVFLFIAALIIFGPKKLPEIGKTLGKGMREFRKATDDLKANWEDHLRDSESPVQDLQQTIHEVKADIEAAASGITSEVEASAGDIKSEVEAATTLEEKPALGTSQEETKTDAHTN